MTYRKLRIAWSVGWGLAAVMIVVLRLRSAHTLDYLEWSRTKYGGTVAVTSFDGECEFMVATYNEIWGGTKPGFTYFARPERFATWAPSWTGFAVGGTDNGNRFLMVPHWFLASIGMLTASASWRPWRFSLRALLVAMTVVGVILGGIVWAVKN